MCERTEILLRKGTTMDQAHPDFDLTFRPDYWRPSDPISLIIANVKGEVRRQQILDVLERHHQMIPPGVDLPEELLQDALSESDRIAWGGIHPAMMGGEYLPDYARGEIEIARIVLASTLMDVTSVRARRTRDLRIHYRVVDEYKTGFRFRPKSSKRPLTLGEMISLLDSIEHPEEGPGRPWIEVAREINYDDNPEHVAHFATVRSPFYPRLQDFYSWRNEQWLAKELARIAAEEGEDAEEEAAR
jgi:hypothetical protein